MAEFCLECFNKVMNAKYKKRHVVLDYDFCEGCGEYKKCVVTVRRQPFSLLITVIIIILTGVLLTLKYLADGFG